MKTASMENTKDAALKTRETGGGLLARPAEWWHRGRTFLAEVRGELKRVTWPSRREVYATTVIVILTSIFFGTYLWITDLLVNRVVTWLFGTLGAV
jgi:preprotein translocase subunit SecE